MVHPEPHESEITSYQKNTNRQQIMPQRNASTAMESSEIKSKLQRQCTDENSVDQLMNFESNQASQKKVNQIQISSLLVGGSATPTEYGVSMRANQADMEKHKEEQTRSQSEKKGQATKPPRGVAQKQFQN